MPYTTWSFEESVEGNFHLLLSSEDTRKGVEEKFYCHLPTKSAKAGKVGLTISGDADQSGRW